MITKVYQEGNTLQMESRKTVEVVAAIIESDNRIFATQRGYGEFKDGWEFPDHKDR